MQNTDTNILSAMVKGRECCRSLVQTYEVARTSESAGSTNISMLTNVDKKATRMLQHLQDLPDSLGESMKTADGKAHAERLLSEIGGLMERAMMLEREVRGNASTRPSASKANGRHRQRQGIRAYGAA